MISEISPDIVGKDCYQHLISHLFDCKRQLHLGAFVLGFVSGTRAIKMIKGQIQ